MLLRYAEHRPQKIPFYFLGNILPDSNKINWIGWGLRKNGAKKSVLIKILPRREKLKSSQNKTALKPHTKKNQSSALRHSRKNGAILIFGLGRNPLPFLNSVQNEAEHLSK